MQNAAPNGNDGKALNYVQGNDIFLLDSLSPQSTAKLIGDMANLAKAANGNPINFYINSPGGKVALTNTIMHWINLARLNGTVVTTTVMGSAGSSASIIAVNGNRGERIMSEYALHLVHFGSVTQEITLPSEVEKAAKNLRHYKERSLDIYTKNTRATRKQLLKIMEDEQGYLNAQECLKLGFCDKVLTANGYQER